MTLALWQGEGVPGDLPATLAEVARIARDAAARGASLLVFPEGFLTGYYIPGLAPGGLSGVEEALARVGAIAAEHDLALVIGTHLDEGAQLRNSAVVFDATGTERGRYHKHTPFGAWERETFAPGTEGLILDLDGLRVGIAICYDVEFPELIRAYAQQGAQLVVVPTALMAPMDHIARLIVPVRALENQIFVGYANRIGREPGLEFVGLSRICGPRGETVAEAGDEPALLLARIEPEAIERERAESSYLEDLAKFVSLRPRRD